MNASTTRMIKEGRALFLPWCFVMSAAVLPWLLSGSRFNFNGPLALPGLLGLWMGLAVLATVSLGNEFQNRTFSLLLSQPVDRMEIWREKWVVMMMAVLSAAAVYSVAWRPALLEYPETG